MYFNQNDKPADGRKWINSEGTCDECGAEVNRYRASRHFFYTLDGWDYMQFNQCERCVKAERLSARRAKAKREREARARVEELAAIYQRASGMPLDDIKKRELYEIIINK